MIKSRETTVAITLLLAWCWLPTGAAAKDKLALTHAPHARSSEGSHDAHRGERAAEAARAGMFLPLTEAPRTDSARAFVVALGGYDSAKESVLQSSEPTARGAGVLALGTISGAM